MGVAHSQTRPASHPTMGGHRLPADPGGLRGTPVGAGVGTAVSAGPVTTESAFSTIVTSGTAELSAAAKLEARIAHSTIVALTEALGATASLTVAVFGLTVRVTPLELRLGT